MLLVYQMHFDVANAMQHILDMSTATTSFLKHFRQVAGKNTAQIAIDFIVFSYLLRPLSASNTIPTTTVTAPIN